MENMDDNDENVESRGLITRYEEKPDSLRNICLADFACWYTENKAVSPFQSRKVTKASGDGYLKENNPSSENSPFSESQNDDDDDDDDDDDGDGAGDDDDDVDDDDDDDDVNQKLQYKSLETDSLNTLRTQMMGVKYIFIDEVSMVGSGMLIFVHRCLQEIIGSACDFGGISVIFVGDLFQIKPVCDSFIFKNNSTGYASLATNLWLGGRWGWGAQD